MKPPKGVTVVSAKHVDEYKFLFTFSNSKKFVTDFLPIINHGTMLMPYLDISKFKKIIIDKENGDIRWGKNYDMCFHIEAYYGETSILPAKQKGGRKPVDDKKVLLRLYVRQSIVNANGGNEAAQERCTEWLNNNVNASK